jgi:hypothetical protein
MENESQNEGSLQEQEINSQNSEELPEEKNKNSKIEEKDNESIVSKSVVSNNKELIVLNPDETVNDVISQFVKIKNCGLCDIHPALFITALTSAKSFLFSLIIRLTCR